ncbi:MAG: ribonuclease R [Methylobacteriaceae bacterium]|nr:ribonuclease R [Methylobacteriaceae bacterium]
MADSSRSPAKTNKTKPRPAKRPGGAPQVAGGSAEAAGRIPSKAEILAFLARESEAAEKQGKANPGKIGKREIARAFGIKGSDRSALKDLLKELVADGSIVRRRKALHKPGVLPQLVLADIIGRDADGELLAAPVEWDEADGEPPRILIHVPARPRPGLAIPAVGDRALVRAEPAREIEPGGPAYAGRVIRLLAKAKAQVLGIFRAVPGAGGRIVPVDKKRANRELLVSERDRDGAEDGDLVAVDVMHEGRFGLPVAKVRERLGSLKSERAVSLIAIHAHGIPHVFKPATVEEAERAKPQPLSGREDWRQLPLLTIDPPDAKDHDDAVQAARDPDPNNPGGHVITVAIADVAAYVRPGSALDREALERGNSVYFPDRVVPMLPERISNDLCSLMAGEDRPALAVRIVIDAEGRKRRHSFHRITMRSVAKLSYEQAQAAINGRPDAVTGPLLETVLKPLWGAYERVKIARALRGPLDLDLPERKLILKPDGTIDRVVTPERLDAHRLIEEFMILANVAAAETLEDKRQALIYRVHDEPSLEKLNALSEFLASIGVKLAKGQKLRPALFNGILARVRGSENQHLVNEVVLRSQAQAEYVAENYGHFGLNLRRYAHFTSPIRRYADLIVHRALIRSLGLGPDGLPDMKLAELAEIAADISAAERRAMNAERETVDRLVAGWLADRIGATFEARISGVTRAGLFVRLIETGADGFVPASTLGDEYFRYDEPARALVGIRSGELHRLGDLVEVKLVEAAPFAGALRFELATEPRSDGGGRHRSRARRADRVPARQAFAKRKRN